MNKALAAAIAAAFCASGAAQAADMTASGRTEASPAPVPVSGPKWSPWAELGGYWGSDDESRGEGVLWAPLWQSPVSLFFAEARGKFFEQDVQEGNFALGYRQMLASGWNIGIWGGLDVRGTEAGSTFWQASGGLEALSADWDLRLNGYLPLEDDKLVARTSATDVSTAVGLTANQIFLSTTTTTTTATTRELALWGFDGEVGYRLFGTPETQPGRRHELRLYGGGFYFDHSDLGEELAGPKARLEWRIDEVIESWAGSRLTMEGEFSHDDVRDDRWEVGARLRLPFGGGGSRYAALSPQERRMMDGLERDTDIVTDTQTEIASESKTVQEGVEDALTDVPFDQVAYVGNGGSITTTSSNAGDNTLIIAEGTISGAQQLEGNQTLQGGGSTIQVRGQKSGTVADFTAPGAAATLDTPGNAPNLTLLGSNTHVAGVEIQGAGPGNILNDGIAGGAGRDTIVIEQSHIAGTGSFGINFGDSNSNVAIRDMTIVDTQGPGIIVNDNNQNVAIAKTQITNPGNDGIWFGLGNSNVTITDTQILNADQDGIEFGNENVDVTIADTVIETTNGDGIFFKEKNDNVSIARTRIANANGDGIFFNNENTNVSIAGVTIDTTTGDGIQFVSLNQNLAITDTTITRMDRIGIFLGSDNTNVSIAKATVANGNDFGIAFGNNNSVNITDTTISDVTFGLVFSDNNVVTLEKSTLAETFVQLGVWITGTGNTFNGAGNTAAGATFGLNLCEDNGNAWTGAVNFDNTLITSANCP